MGLKNEYDVEQQYGGHTYAGEKHRDIVVPDDAGAVPGESFVVGDTLYAKLQRFVGRYGVEQRGIERVPDYERTDTNTVKVGTMVRSLRQHGQW